MPSRRATCACGQLAVTLAGEPYFVALCNCTDCQRRTGSIYGVGAYFEGAQVAGVSGEARRFTKVAVSGRRVQFHFCPTCGTSLYWTGPDAPVSEGLGIAVGCFADPQFPKPHLVAWCASQVAWATFPEGVPRRRTQPDRLTAEEE